MNSTHQNMHREHILWESDLAMWTHDLKMWESELANLEEIMEFFEEAVKQHKLALIDHMRVLASHKSRLERHEIDLGLVREGSPLDVELSEEHTTEQARHTQQFNAHERLKRYHHSLIALSNSLRQALDSPI